ncbi:MAG: S8/S53 family peptidase [Candidatus Paceibacterota bacterium]
MAERIILTLEPPAAEERVLELTKGFGGRITGGIPQLNSFEVAVDNLDEAISSLLPNPEVRFVNRNYFFEATWDNEDYANTHQEAFDGLWWSRETHLINGLKQLEGYEGTLNPVTIAVIDTSFDLNDSDIPYYRHSDDRPSTLSGYDFGDNDADVDSPIASGTHGTIVSSFIAAKNDGKRTNGVASVGKNLFSILPLKVISEDLVKAVEYEFNMAIVGDDFRIASALEYSGEKRAEYNIKVINVSQGGSPFLPEWLSDWVQGQLHLMKNRTLVQDAIDDLDGKGIIVVAAAGNNNGNACDCLPSAHKNVISVGGTRFEENLEGRYIYGGNGSNYSSNINCLEISAPAQKLLAFNPAGQEIYYHGTSFAAPQVSGLVALIRSIRPEAGFDEVVRLLRDNADDVPLTGDPISEVAGQVWKRINVEKTVRAILPPSCKTVANVLGSTASLGYGRISFRGEEGLMYMYDIASEDISETDASCPVPLFQGNGLICLDETSVIVSITDDGGTVYAPPASCGMTAQALWGRRFLFSCDGQSYFSELGSGTYAPFGGEYGVTDAALSGDLLVYIDSLSYLRAYDITNGSDMMLSEAPSRYPRINGSNIVFSHTDALAGLERLYLMQASLLAPALIEIGSTPSITGISSSGIWGDNVVYSLDGQGAYLYSISAGMSRPLYNGTIPPMIGSPLQIMGNDVLLIAEAEGRRILVLCRI